MTITLQIIDINNSTKEELLKQKAHFTFVKNQLIAKEPKDLLDLINLIETDNTLDRISSILAYINESTEEPVKEKPEFFFSKGEKVSKTNGDYRFDGIVVSAFKKLSGEVRYVVEDDRGILHIYSNKNLVSFNKQKEGV